MSQNNSSSKTKRLLRLRKSLLAVTDRPRLSVHRSNQHISGQIIDKSGKILSAFSSQALKDAKGTGIEIASQVGVKLGELAKDSKVTTVVFDRGAYKYHGRVKALAEAVRQSGIKF